MLRLSLVGAASFAVLYLLAYGISMLYPMPHQMAVSSRVAAAVFVAMFLAWFVAELCRGGGDPNRR
jgi:hypothetical protein